nr:N-acetyl-gamma-glutamyl-phosphate reductase [Desulfobacterales bacterium]
MIRAAVVGGTGYTGAELVRILAGHPQVKLTVISSRQYAGIPFSEVYPCMCGIIDLDCQAMSVKDIVDKADVIFTALPHKVSMSVVPDFVQQGKKVVDLSADFRFWEPDIYEAWYEPHTAKELLQEVVYGLTEVFFEEIRSASLVGNPGCYPTCSLLPLVPLIDAPFLDHDTIIIDAKSGVSGAGRSLSLSTHYCEVNEALCAYKVTEHRHSPEMEQVLSMVAHKEIRITFTPHLIPLTRGMFTTIYVNLKEPVSEDEILSRLESFYKDRPFIRILPGGQVPNTKYVRGTNYCDIGFRIDKRVNRLILLSAIDNLAKGASGQAVQNMNVMFGLPETAGLNSCPFPI